MTELIAVTITQAVQLSGIGRSSIYQAISRGELPIRKWGRRSVILVDDLRRWLESLPEAELRNRAA